MTKSMARPRHNIKAKHLHPSLIWGGVVVAVTLSVVAYYHIHHADTSRSRVIFITSPAASASLAPHRTN
jgi:hypothetical protein